MALILDESIAGGRPTKPVRPVRLHTHLVGVGSDAIEGIAQLVRSARVRLVDVARI